LDKAALEAIAAGCIVISSNDAVRTMLRMIQDGLAIEQAEPELFAEAVQRVHEMDEMTLEKIRGRGRDMLKENHSLDALVKKILWVFQGNK